MEISKTDELDFFLIYRIFGADKGSLREVPRYLEGCQFFCSYSVSYILYSKNKIFGNLINGRARFFFRLFRIFGANKGSLREVPRYLEGCKFFCSYSVPIYGISIMKFLAISKADELDFFPIFSFFRSQ